MVGVLSRELKRKAERANNVWWRLSGLLGAENRVYMYAIIQAAFTVATLALTVPMFKSYRLHIGFEVFKLAATVWNGGNFIFEVMPRQAAKKLKNGGEIHSIEDIPSMVYASQKHATEIIDANAESMVCFAKDECGYEEQAVCALCRRTSHENLAKLSLLYSENCDGEVQASQLLRSLLNKQKTLPGRRTGTSSSRDSLVRGLEWRRQVACGG